MALPRPREAIVFVRPIVILERESIRRGLLLALRRCLSLKDRAMIASSLLKISRTVKLLLTFGSVFSFLPVIGAQTQQQIFPITPLSTPPGISENVSGRIQALVPGDFNGDGQPDLAYVVPAPLVNGAFVGYPTVVILLNEGSSNAPTPIVTNMLSCTAGYSLVAADLNNDKKLDLALTCAEGYVAVLLGNGDGSFETASYYAVAGVGLGGIAPPIDLNGDGYLDIAVSSQAAAANQPSAVNVLLNKGGSGPGIFSAARSYSGPPSISFTALGVGDFNGDGKQDILAGGALVFYGNGDGTLQAPQTISDGGVFTTGDFNNDGITDVAYIAVTPDRSKQTLMVLLGDSSGTPTSASSLLLPTSSLYTALIPIGSPLGTGNVSDLALVGDNTTILFGNGNSGFNLGPGYALTSGPGLVVNQPGAGGIANLVYVTPDDYLAVLPGVGDGTFSGVPNSSLSMSSSFVVADVNNDGLTDVLSMSSGGNFVTALARGNGRFTITSQIATPGSILLAGDFEGDGKTDAVTLFPGIMQSPSSAQDAQLYFYKGNGDGSFQPSPPGVDLPLIGVGSVVAGDFNGDKKPDIVLFSAAAPDNSFIGGVFLLAGKGDGSFASPVMITQQVSDSPSGFLIADLNGDQQPDLILGTNVFLGNGGGTFRKIPLGLTGTPMAVGDLNGDGIPDIVMKTTPYVVSVYAGNGDGTFQSSPIYSTPPTPTPGPLAVSIGDVNADGHADLVVQDSIFFSSTTVLVFLGDGAGNFIADSVPYFAGVTLTSGPTNIGILTRLNNQAPALAADNALDYLTLSDNGATVLLNAHNPSPVGMNKLVSRTALTASSNNAAPGEEVTFTATLTGDNPDGNVSFVSGSTTLGSMITTDGVASLTKAFPAAGMYSVVANYSGDINNQPSASNSVTVSVAHAATQTALAVSTTNANQNQQLSRTATVTGFNPSGNVTFMTGSTSLGTAPIANGMATLPFSFAAAGTYAVTASYAGDSANLASVSNPISIVVAAPDFTIAASPTSATIAAGQSAMTTITVTPAGGYSGTMKFSCGTLPSGSTCTFAPASVTPANGTATTTLTVATTAPSSAMLIHKITGSLQGIAWAGICCFAFSLRRRWRSGLKRMRSGFLILILATGLIVISGCGSGSSASMKPPANPGTPMGAQMITIVATDSAGGPSHSITFQVTIR